MNRETRQITVYGAQWCGDCIRAKRILDQYEASYQWIDVDGDEQALDIVRKANNGMRSIPTIFFPDGSILVEPSNGELLKKLAQQS